VRLVEAKAVTVPPDVIVQLREKRRKSDALKAQQGA